MAIYKLGDICNIKTGNLNKNDSTTKGKFKFYTRSQNILLSDQYTFEGEYIIIPGEGIFMPLWAKGKIGVHQRVYAINSNNKEILMDKYLYYWWLVNKDILNQSSVGSTVKSLRKSNFENPSIHLPSIIEQKKIIDIIEPLELMYDQVLKIKKKLWFLEKNIISNSDETIHSFEFEKGGMPNKEPGSTPFLNVSAANNKINRFVSNEANIFPGDVTLSLDGNCGLVNNSLYGFNGYLYKVTSDLFEPWQVYYSLLTKESQNIIKINETGTTIKHSSNSKKQLKVRSFVEEDFLQKAFELTIKIKKIIYLIEVQKESLIKLLIK